MSKIKAIFNKNYSLYSALFIFILSVFIISPWGNYAVNDDWQFFTHVRYFSEGNFKKNPLIDASFILQGYFGLVWSQIFGLSFTSLRVLTIIFTILFLFGFYKTLDYLKVNKKLILIGFFCLLIEPFVLTSSLSYMTEIYFLTFMIWSVYFFLKFIEDKKLSHNFVLAIMIGSLSILIRQFGIVLFVGYLISIFWIFKLNKKSIFLNTLLLFFFLSTILYNFNFPQYAGVYDSKEEKLLTLLVNYKDLGEKISFYPKYLIYIIFYLAPVLVLLILKKNYLKIILLSIPLSLLIFSIDIFDLKNVFHLECYYCESNFYHQHSIFDNIIFKLLLSFFLAYLAINTFFVLLDKKIFSKFSLKKIENKNIVLSILTLGMFLIVLAVDSFYDRYFINFSVLFIILIILNLNNIEVSLKLPIIVFSIFYLIILFLNIEFHNSTYLKWKQGMELNKTTGLRAQILVSGAFSRFLNAKEKPPEDLVRPVKFGAQKCFVLRHVKNSDIFLIKFLELKIFNNKYFNNPTFSNLSNINELPKPKIFLSKSIYVDEYFSPMFNLIGQKTYIVSYCLDEVTNRYNMKTVDYSSLK